MSNLTAHQEYLLLGKVSNTLNKRESKEWEQMVKQMPDVAEAFKQFSSRLPSEEMASGFGYLDDPGYWDDLALSFGKRPIAPKPYIRFLRSRWAAAAVFVGIIALSAVLWGRFRQRGMQVASQKPSVELRLADGSAVNLSQHQGRIKTGITSLSNSNNTLTYTVNASADARSINILTVPIGLDYKIFLADGTEVWLNSATELKFPLAFLGNSREIAINGEAYLKVAKDAGKPFIVHLPHSSVKVLGTEFNVNTYDSGIVAVALVEGSVNLQTPGGDANIVAGKQAIYTKGQPIRQEPFDPTYVLGWRQGLFYFDEATLEEISKVVPRWYGMQVVIDNPAIKDKKFAGVLDRKQSISVFQGDLKLISGIDSYVDRDNVLHFK